MPLGVLAYEARARPSGRLAPAPRSTARRSRRGDGRARASRNPPRFASPMPGWKCTELVGDLPGKPTYGRALEFPPDYLPALVHEFLHGYVNPWIDRHLSELRSGAAALAGPVLEPLSRLGYPTTQMVLDESVVRAFTIRYLRENGRGAEADAALPFGVAGVPITARRSRLPLAFKTVSP